MEDPTRLRPDGGLPRRRRRGWTGRWALLLVSLAPLAAAGAEIADTEIARALAGFGSPGILWGRLAVEEESPEGSLTPLAGVEVTLYPYLPALEQALERIRTGARESPEAYVGAPGAVRETLEAYRKQTAAVGGAQWTPQRVTDGAGLFVFDTVPAGPWLLVAVQRTPVRASPGALTRRPRPADPRFVPRAGAAPSHGADIWVVRVQVRPGERTPLLLTERSRWMTGPLR